MGHWSAALPKRTRTTPYTTGLSLKRESEMTKREAATEMNVLTTTDPGGRITIW
jgi:hypothetical protein